MIEKWYTKLIQERLQGWTLDSYSPRGSSFKARSEILHLTRRRGSWTSVCRDLLGLVKTIRMNSEPTWASTKRSSSSSGAGPAGVRPIATWKIESWTTQLNKYPALEIWRPEMQDLQIQLWSHPDIHQRVCLEGQMIWHAATVYKLLCVTVENLGVFLCRPVGASWFGRLFCWSWSTIYLETIITQILNNAASPRGPNPCRPHAADAGTALTFWVPKDPKFRTWTLIVSIKGVAVR